MTVKGWSDDELREVLRLYHIEGMPYSQVGAKVGRSKSSVIGMMSRCSKEAEAIPCKCKKKENKDGLAGLAWWG